MTDKMKVTVLECGRVILPSCALFREEDAFYPFAMITKLRSRDALINAPVFCFLIEHPNGKKIVYDTAWSSMVRAHPWRNMAASHLVDQPILPPGQCINERVAALGYKNADIDYVILSHMHIDHAGGVKNMAGAQKFMVSRAEYEVAGKGGIAAYRKCCWDGVAFELFDYDDLGIGPLGKAKDLFGDGSVLLIATPGHTPGHTSILLRHGGKQLLLAGDNGYARKSWRDGILPGLMKDPENMERSLKWEKDFHDSNDDLIDVISDHETELDQFLYEF